MEKLNFIIDFIYEINPIWFSVIPIFVYPMLRNKFKNAFTNLVISNNNDDSETKERVNNLFILLEIAFLVIYIFAIWDLILVDKNIKDFGQWGDFFGGIVNPILTFITFIALLITIVLQQIELKESRKEFKRSATALKGQEKYMELQTFENTFFKMVELHNNIVENLSYGENNGRNVFATIFKKTIVFRHLQNIIDKYQKININQNYILGHYFRNLYQILKFLKSKEQTLGQDKAKSYANILRSQLSSYELILLFINCFDKISDNGEFKKLLIHYSFLQHIPFFEIKIKTGYLDSSFYYGLNKKREDASYLIIKTINNTEVFISTEVFCQYYENKKSAFDGNEVVEKIKPYLECNK